MIGSNVLVNAFERPSKKPIGVPMSRAMAYPLPTRISEYQVKRRMPWSISPRFSNGFSTYCLLAAQVFAGDGNSFAHVLLDRCHSKTTSATPASGRMSQSIFFRDDSFMKRDL